MKPLSPQAQAVLDAYGDFEPANVDAMAAALRAAADQMAAWVDNDGKIELDDLLAIADELEQA